MRVTVTGGCGFIASHLVDALIERGDSVTVIDDMSNGYEQNKNPKAAYHKMGVQELVIPYMFETLKPETVFHLACYPRSVSFQNPFRDLMVNYDSTLQLCEVAKKQKFHIIFSSNSGLMGAPIKAWKCNHCGKRIRADVI